MPGCRYGLLRMISAKCRLVQESTRSTDKKRPNTIPVYGSTWIIFYFTVSYLQKNHKIYIPMLTITAIQYQTLIMYFESRSGNFRDRI